MTLLQRKILMRMAAATGVAYGCIVSVFATIQVLNQVNILFNSSAALGKTLLLALFVLPQLTVDLLPFAFLIGIVGVLTLMNSDSELVVIRAAGGGWSVVSIPIHTLGTAVAVTCLFVSLIVEPLANRQIPGVINATVVDALRAAARPGGPRRVGDGVLVWIGETLPGGSPGGILVIDTRDPAVQRIHVAQEASLVQAEGKELFVLAEGFSQHKTAEDGEVLSVAFQTYAIDLAEIAPAAGRATLRPKERPTASLLSPDPEDRVASERPDLLRMELHRRLSNWLYALAFGTAAAYFVGAVRPDRRRRARNAALAIGAGLLVRSAGFITLNEAGTSTAMAALVYAIPLLTIVLFLCLEGLRSGTDDPEPVTKLSQRVRALVGRGLPDAATANALEQVQRGGS